MAMTRAEMQEKLEEQQKIIDDRKKKIKDQNKKAKELWDTVSCRLPKGTKDRITERGLTVNGLINKLVLEYLNGENYSMTGINTNCTNETQQAVNINREAQKQKDEDNRKKLLQQIDDAEFGIKQRKDKELSE